VQGIRTLTYGGVSVQVVIHMPSASVKDALVLYHPTVWFDDRTLPAAENTIDNFKRLNDTLGHAAGDVALKSLAAAVRERLRPQDHLARFGGEEFVVIRPGTALEEAAQALTRLQRSLTEALFLHEGREVFVTFSAGVTAWRDGEALEPALERADQGLYEAKRTGKNRTCAA
jgi:diguanylate cyclase